MDGNELIRRLNESVNLGRLDEGMDELVDQLESSDAGIELVAPLLRFMEAHPMEDYGSPGPLVHFMEDFHKRGYEDELLRSLDRQPIPHTVWMLNRLINGEKDVTERGRLIDILLGVQDHPLADDETKEKAWEFYEHQQQD